MRSTKVVSSNIDQVGWQDHVLYVAFLNGRKYLYKGVPEIVYERLCNAESVGKEFNASVKKLYEHTLLTDDPFESN